VCPCRYIYLSVYIWTFKNTRYTESSYVRIKVVRQASKTYFDVNRNWHFTLIADDRRRPHLNECMPQTRLNNSGLSYGISVLLIDTPCSGVPFTVKAMPINTKSNTAVINKFLLFIFVCKCTVLKYGRSRVPR